MSKCMFKPMSKVDSVVVLTFVGIKPVSGMGVLVGVLANVVIGEAMSISI